MIKHFLFYILCCLFPLLTQAQVELAGRWEGYLDQSKGASQMDGYKEYWERGLWDKGEKTHDLELTFKYDKRKRSYTGEYYINEAINKSHFARFAIKASTYKTTVRYHTTSKVFETKNTLNLGFCYSKATLNWSEDDKYEYLEGSWQGWNDNGRACAPAHIWVRRKKRQPVTPEPPTTPPVAVTPVPKKETPAVVAKPEPKEEPKPVEETNPKEAVEPVAPKEEVVVEQPAPKPEPKVEKVPESSPEPTPSSPAEAPRKQVVNTEVTTDKEWMTIEVWDGNREDGDIISLNYNGEIILKEYLLKNKKKVLKIKLEKGTSYLTLIAHNLGDIPPNTAAVSVIRNDGSKKVITLKSDMGTSEAIRFVR